MDLKTWVNPTKTMFMQKILYVIATLFIVNFQTAVAQDIFTLKNGTTLKARYIDRTNTQIRYKKWGNADFLFHTNKTIKPLPKQSGKS